MNMHLKPQMALGRRSAALLAGVSGLGFIPLCAADVSVRFVVDSAWSDGYNAHIEIENVGASTIEGWELSYTDGPEISSLWNADWEVVGDRTILSSLEWNSVLAPGA